MSKKRPLRSTLLHSTCVLGCSLIFESLKTEFVVFMVGGPTLQGTQDLKFVGLEYTQDAGFLTSITPYIYLVSMVFQ